MLADGLAVQYDEFVEALDELIDNAWSAAYGDQLTDVDPVNIEVAFLRDGDKVWVVIADDGPGITRQVLENHYFRTGDQSASAGLLNQKGWGSGNALSWFEFTQSSRSHGFRLRTSAATGEPTKEVTGPVTGELAIKTTEVPWHADSTLTDPTGTCLMVPCSWSEFKTAYGKGSSRLTTIAQAIRLHLGVVYRDLITAHPDSSLTLRWGDINADMQRTEPVVPIFPEYRDEVVTDEFTLTVEEGTYEIELEHGVLDLESMVETVEETSPGLLSSTGTFRLRYRPNQRCQGVDVFANGREIELSVFTDLWDMKRHNNYNRYGGRLKVHPQGDSPLPTDNKKTRLDRTSDLWSSLVEQLQQRGSPIKSGSVTAGSKSSRSEGESSSSATTSKGGVGSSEEPQTDEQQSDENNGENDPDSSEGGNDSTDSDQVVDPRSLGHSAVVNRLAEKLREESATARVYTEKGYDGVHVDVVQMLTTGEVVLWEVKRPGMQPACKEIYHLLMYHDHYSRAKGQSPQSVNLLSDPLSGNGQADLDALDGRASSRGGEYSLNHVDFTWLVGERAAASGHDEPMLETAVEAES